MNGLTRRNFLGALATLSAASAVGACVAPEADDGDVFAWDDPSTGGALSALTSLTLDLKADCGAKGDGRTNDTAAFQDAAERIWAAGGGVLTIPPGTYIVGRQKKKTATSPASDPFYKHEDIFTINAEVAHPVTKKVTAVSRVQINGFGAVIKVASGLHYGGFDPESGAPMDDAHGRALNGAQVGRVFNLKACSGVWLRGMEIDGNSPHLILGGQWGNVDRQAAATGILFDHCWNVAVTDVHTHHHALDGIAVEHHGAPPTVTMPHRLSRVVSEYNGRQGMSWIGGRGLTCIDCKFNHTGRAINQGTGTVLKSAPGAGVDIEPNANTLEKSSEGSFTGCEFIDNAGAGLLSSVGRGGYSTFTDCTFWGTTSYSLWLGHPGLVFTQCRIYGTAVHAGDGRTVDSPAPNRALATVFDDCDFEDKEWTNGTVRRAGYLYDLPIVMKKLADGTTVPDGSHSGGATWKNCRFKANKVRGVSVKDATSKEYFTGCTFTHGLALGSAGDWQSSFAGSRLTSCHFTESSTVGSKTYRIDLDAVVVVTPPAGAAPTHVDGPHVRWRTSTGPVGNIAPGTYST